MKPELRSGFTSEFNFREANDPTSLEESGAFFTSETFQFFNYLFFFFMSFQTFAELRSAQVILMPISFGLLFSLMLLYWGQAAIFSYNKYNKFTTILFFSCIISLTLLLICRFLDSGHLPLSNLYESLLFLSWSFLVIQFFLQINSLRENWKNPFKERSSGFKRKGLDQDQFTHFLGVIMSPMSLLTYGFAFLNLPKEMQKSTSLVPALQSNWLMMHVTIMILSYAALLCGSILSMAFLLLNFLEKRNLESEQTISTQTQPFASRNAFDDVSYQTRFSLRENLNNNQIASRQIVFNEENVVFLDQDMATSLRDGALSLAAKLDNYSYRVLSLGFPLLTIGILSGAVWANQAWGSYWSWDPKESWALITWLVFAIYLHARITKGWSGQRPAMIATFGFFVVWFCYLGVNLLGAGLHSYGWFSK